MRQHPRRLTRGGRAAIIVAVCAALVAAWAVVRVLRQPGQPPASFAASVTVDPSGKVDGGINSHYVGLSFESGTINGGGFDDVGDLAPLLKNLGSGVLRFGGNSVDRASFTGATPSALAGLARLARASGWSVLYSEGLGTFQAAASGAVTADAQRVSAALGPNLAAIACGNEPDAYRPDGPRSAWTESQYVSREAGCLDAIRAGAPSATLAGPDTAGTSWLARYAASEAGTAGWLDQHYYALGCPQGGRSLNQLANDLLSPAQAAREAAMFAVSAAAARAAHAQLHVSETNSACGGGFPGLSNSYASALWAVDYLLAGAKGGVDGMNFHGGLTASCQRYTPLCQVGANEYAAQPLYYGLLFTHLLGSGHLLPVSVATSAGSAPAGYVTAFALRPLSGGLRLIVENLGPHQANATLQAGGNPGSASVLRLAGPSLLATSGVTIQGATVAADGSFTPGAADRVGCSGGRCPVTIAPYSAVLVTVG